LALVYEAPDKVNTMTEIARLSTADADFDARLDALLAWESVSDDRVQQTVAEVIQAVRTRGDGPARLHGPLRRLAASLHRGPGDPQG